jgi:hypothetical protein
MTLCRFLSLFYIYFFLLYKYYFFFQRKGLFIVIAVISLIINNISDTKSGIYLEYNIKKRHETKKKRKS